MFRQAARTVAAILGGYLTTLALTAAAFIAVALARNGAGPEPGLAWRVLLVLLNVPNRWWDAHAALDLAFDHAAKAPRQ